MDGPAAPPAAAWSLVERGETRSYLRRDAAQALRDAGLEDPEGLRDAAHATFQGRGDAFAVDVPGVGGVFVRKYLHGGILRRMTGDLFAGDGRFRDEVDVLVEAARAGVPVPQALGYVSRGAGFGLRRGWLLAREVPGAQDVMSYLGGEPPAAERRATLVAAGRAARALHDAGFEHADLHMRNLLRTPDGRVLVLDLDRARRREELPRRRRLSALFRLDRHADKQHRAGHRVSRADRLRLLRAYAGDDWPGREEVRDLARALAEHIARHRVVARSRAAG